MELIRKIYSTLAGNRKDVEVTKGWYKCLQSGSFLGHLAGAAWRGRPHLYAFKSMGGGDSLLCSRFLVHP